MSSSKLYPPIVFGVFGTFDPRLDGAGPQDRERSNFIVKMTAAMIADHVKMPDGNPVNVFEPKTLVGGERDADIVAGMFKGAGVQVLVCVSDTWAYPGKTAIALANHFPNDMPLLLLCGNSAPKPGVVFDHACSGAFAQMGRKAYLIVGTWDDVGQKPVMTVETASELISWCYGMLPKAGWKGKRLLFHGAHSMEMETAMAHVIATRNQFGVHISMNDMTEVSDRLTKREYSDSELYNLRRWMDRMLGKRIQIRNVEDEGKFQQELAMYLITRNLMNEVNAIGGGFMSQLSWGSDKRILPRPVADAMESLHNSTFDHNGPKTPRPYATESDAQGGLTMLLQFWISGGMPPLFADFRKVWEANDLADVAASLKVVLSDDGWAKRGIVDYDNSGSASFNWAGKPGMTAEECTAKVSMPLADEFYFPGGGNSVTFMTPGDIDMLTGRLWYVQSKDRWALTWDDAVTCELPAPLANKLASLSSPGWPHTWVMFKNFELALVKHISPANHWHAVWNTDRRRLMYAMDALGIQDLHASKFPAYTPGHDIPPTLLSLIK
ncbi:MAG: hypothetical protein NTW11_01170 [Candidatus Staskawiczbacteria bacterium]|nr:hypothetical protein [Candidatus Staskawiczbacteria bacterium]